MTLDPQVYALASARLLASGWHHDGTIRELAELLQSAIEEFESDLQDQYELDAQEAHHDRSR